MSTEHPEPADHLVDDSLSASYTALVADLATALDLTAGAADATHPATYAALTSDLAQTLDVDAGLVAIVGTTSPLPHSPTASSHTAGPGWRPSGQLVSLTDAERLTLRSHPAYSKLCSTLDLLVSLARARARALDRAHALELDRAHALELDFDIGPALDRALARARDLELDCARDLDLALNLDFLPDLDLDRVLTRVLDRDRDRDRELDRAEALVRALARDPAALDINLVLVRIRAIDRVLVSTLDLAFDLACDRAYDLAPSLGLDLDLLGGDKRRSLKYVQGGLAELRALLGEVGDDFMGADLRAAGHLALGDLTGVRWSSDTMWPPSWEDRVRRVSTEIEPGIFRVQGDNRKHSLNEAST